MSRSLVRTAGASSGLGTASGASWLRGLVALALLCGSVAPASAARRPKPNDVAVEDELPPWMIKGDQVRLELIEHLLDNNNVETALDLIRTMRNEGRETPLLDLFQGIALVKVGVNSEAERLLIDASKHLTRDARPFSTLCLLYADEQRVEEAISACEKATRFADRDAAIWNNYGYLLLTADRVEEALVACSHAVENDPIQPRYRNNLALAQAASGRPEQAFKTLQSTVDRAEAAYSVGLALERFHDDSGALEYYQRAIQSDPGHAGAAEAIARISGEPLPSSAEPLPSSAPRAEPLRSPAPQPEPHPGSAPQAEPLLPSAH